MAPIAEDLPLDTFFKPGQQDEPKSSYPPPDQILKDLDRPSSYLPPDQILNGLSQGSSYPPRDQILKDLNLNAYPPPDEILRDLNAPPEPELIPPPREPLYLPEDRPARKASLQNQFNAASDSPLNPLIAGGADVLGKVVAPWVEPFKAIPGAQALGRSINAWGDLTKAAFWDLAGLSHAATSGDTSYTGNISALTRGEPLPWEEQIKLHGGAAGFFSDVIGAMAHMVPELLLAKGLGAAGATPEMAAAGAFGWTPEGFDPKNAAIMGAFPVVAKMGENAALKLLGDKVVSQAGRKAIGLVGGLAASQTLLDLSSAKDYISMTPGEAFNTWAKNFGINVLLHAASIPGLLKESPIEARTLADEFLSQAQAAREAGSFKRNKTGSTKGTDSSEATAAALKSMREDPNYEYRKEFTVLFQSVDPALYGTTHEAVDAYAQSLGLKYRRYEPPTPGEPSAQTRPQPEGDQPQRPGTPTGVQEVRQDRTDQTQVPVTHAPDIGGDSGVQGGQTQVIPVLPTVQTQPEGGVVNGQAKTETQKTQVGLGQVPAPLREEGLANNPVESMTPQPVPSVPVSGTFDIRFAPVFKRLVGFVNELNKTVVGFAGVKANNTQATAIDTVTDPNGNTVVLVNPKILHEETKDMTPAKALKHIAKTLGETAPSERKYAAPSQTSDSVVDGTRLLNEALGTTTLPDKIKVIHDPSQKFGGYFENGQVVINTAWSADPVATLLEEGLHGVIEAIKTGELKDPELESALKDLKSKVDQARIDKQRQRRTGLDTRHQVLEEEALIDEILNYNPSLLRRIWEAIKNAFRKLFGIKVQESAYSRAVDAAKAWLINENVGLTGERRFSYASKPEDVTLAGDTGQTMADRTLSAVHATAQAAEIAGWMERYGAADLSPKSQGLLGYPDFAGIVSEASRINSGIHPSYAGAKELLKTPGQRNYLSRLVHQRIAQFIMDSDSLIKSHKDEAERMQSPGSLRRLAREAAAELKKNQADMVRDVSASIFDSAFELASKSLKEKASTDRDIANLEGQMKGIDAASKSPEAMRQILEDIIKTISSDDKGFEILSNMTGIQPDVTARQIVSAYQDIKRSTAGTEPVRSPYDPNLVQWAAMVLVKSRDVRENLLAQYLSNQGHIHGLMGAYQTKILSELEKNPIGVMRRALKDRGRLTTDANKAAFAWQKLHEPLMKELNDFAELTDAAEVAQKVRSDPEFDVLFRQVAGDVERFGPVRFQPFIDKSMVLPDGTALTTDTNDMVGDKTRFAKLRSEWEKGLETFDLWLNDPPNKTHPDRRQYQAARDDLERYYYGRAMLQPNDTTGISKATWGILWNAFDRAGGRVAASGKFAVHEYESITQKANWWNQKWTAVLETKALQAFKSHKIQWSDFKNVGTLVDANKLWREKVGNELASSHSRQSGGLLQGEKLGSGWTVTKEDMDYLKEQSNTGVSALDILGGKHVLADTLGLNGAVVYRRPSKAGPYMVPRMFNFDMVKRLGEPVSGAYLKLISAIISGDLTLKNTSQKNLLGLFDSHFKEIGYSMIRDRGDSHSNTTPFDGPSGAFNLIANEMTNGLSISNMDELGDALASRSMLTKEESLEVVIQEWGRMISNWTKEAQPSETMVLTRAEEASNSFTKSRNRTLAPYIFYKYGFNTNHDMAVHAAGIYSRAVDVLNGAMLAVIEDLKRVSSKLEDEIKSGISKKESLSSNKKELQSGGTYDRYQDVELRLHQMQTIQKQLIGDRSDVDLGQTFARSIAALTGAQISGINTTARNIFGGPFYMAGVFNRLSASNAYTFPMAMYYGWVRTIPQIFTTMGISGAKGVGKFGYYALKGVTYDPIKRKFKAHYNGTPPPPAEDWFTKAMGSMIEEIGNSMYDRLSSLHEMSQEGPNQTHFIPDARRLFTNRLLGSVLYQGHLVEKNLEGFQKLSQIALGLYETFIGSILNAYAPLYGDSALNMSISDFMNSSVGPIRQLEDRARALLKDYRKMGLTDFKGRTYRFDEVFPRFGMGRILTNERDIAGLRAAFNESGMDFDTIFSRFLGELQAGKADATLLTEEEMAAMTNMAINYSNRPTTANTPMVFRSRHPIAQFAKPFFSWKARQFSNLGNLFQWPLRSDRHRALVWITLITSVLIPMMLLGLANREFDEAGARVVAGILWNQVRSSRHFWERDTLKSQALGALTASLSGVPFLDMAVTAAFDDLPNRASLDPSLVVVQKMKDVARYVGGVSQTGDIFYKLPELIGNLLPDTKIIINRLSTQEGKREAQNVVALLRRSGPSDMLRPTAGSGAVTATPYTPLIQKMENAAVRGDDTQFQAAYQDALQQAGADGKPNPEGYVSQLFGARNAFNRVLSGKMTQEQMDTFNSRLSPTEQANITQYQQRFQAAAQSIGSPASFVKEASPPSGVGSGSRMARGTTRLGGRGRSRRISTGLRSRRIGTGQRGSSLRARTRRSRRF